MGRRKPQAALAVLMHLLIDRVFGFQRAPPFGNFPRPLPVHRLAKTPVGDGPISALAGEKQELHLKRAFRAGWHHRFETSAIPPADVPIGPNP